MIFYCNPLKAIPYSHTHTHTRYTHIYEKHPSVSDTNDQRVVGCWLLSVVYILYHLLYVYHTYCPPLYVLIRWFLRRWVEEKLRRENLPCPRQVRRSVWFRVKRIFILLYIILMTVYLYIFALFPYDNNVLTYNYCHILIENFYLAYSRLRHNRTWGDARHSNMRILFENIFTVRYR